MGQGRDTQSIGNPSPTLIDEIERYLEMVAEIDSSRLHFIPEYFDGGNEDTAANDLIVGLRQIVFDTWGRK